MNYSPVDGGVRYRIQREKNWKDYHKNVVTTCHLAKIYDMHTTPNFKFLVLIIKCMPTGETKMLNQATVICIMSTS